MLYFPEVCLYVMTGNESESKRFRVVIFRTEFILQAFKSLSVSKLVTFNRFKNVQVSIGSKLMRSLHRLKNFQKVNKLEVI